MKRQMLHEAWQLKLFRKTLKKRQRLNCFRRILGALSPEEECLLVTCGDNNGAINYHLRSLGGHWSWAELETDGIDEMEQLLSDTVHRVEGGTLPFVSESFDTVTSIDVHEHIREPAQFMREMNRVVRPGGRVIVSVPGGDPRKLANRLKKWVGMTREKYGHEHDGFSEREIFSMMRDAGIEPVRGMSFSRFFTELVELAINFAYVNVLAARSGVPVEEGTIAPKSGEQLRAIRRTYRLYSLIYPAVWLFSRLDLFLTFGSGYVVICEGLKPRSA